MGPEPQVSLAPDASNSPQSQTKAQGEVIIDPANIFTSEAVTASASGTLGPTGAVTSSTEIQDVNRLRMEILGEDNYDCCRPSGAPYDRTDPPAPASPQPPRPVT